MKRELTPTQQQALTQFGLNELPNSLRELDQKILKAHHVYPKDWSWKEVSAYQTLLEALGHEPWWRQSMSFSQGETRNNGDQ